METVTIPGTDLEVSRIALGTWAIGGWMWGGRDEKESIDTIHAALDRGVTLIDTAPVYGFGSSEEIVGQALKQYGRRDRTCISTKAGLAWDGGKPLRNAHPDRIVQEVEDSLRRLQTDVIDIYFIHWPDPAVPFEETARTVDALRDQGKIRVCGVSNFSPDQMERFRSVADLNLCQPPYNLFERQIEIDVMPYCKDHGTYCKDHGIALMTYGAICRGLLSGKMTTVRQFGGDDLRKVDPKFQPPRFEQYLAAANRIEQLARDLHDKSLLAAAVRWVLDMGAEIAIWGGRRPMQMEPIDEVLGWHVSDAFKIGVDRILSEEIQDPVGPEFMAPPAR
jgi:aryl-alcohol dehydrogenase-like predicted oxidoreductase